MCEADHPGRESNEQKPERLAEGPSAVRHPRERAVRDGESGQAEYLDDQQPENDFDDHLPRLARSRFIAEQSIDEIVSVEKRKIIEPFTRADEDHG